MYSVSVPTGGAEDSVSSSLLIILPICHMMNCENSHALATGFWLLAFGYWLLATGFWLLAVTVTGVAVRGGRYRYWGGRYRYFDEVTVTQQHQNVS